MTKYQVRFFSGDYSPRQRAANNAKAICYIEGHYNWWNDESTNRVLCKVASNASMKSKNWGRYFTRLVAAEFSIPNGSVEVGGRGDANLKHTTMPALLLEPWFISNKEGSLWAKSPEKQEILAKIIVQTIHDEFPNGGLVALSIGHKGKTSKPNDRGARAYGAQNLYESDLVEPLLKKVEALLLAEEKPKIKQGTEEVGNKEFFIAMPGQEERWGDDSGQFLVYSKTNQGLIIPARAFLAWLLQITPAEAPINWDNATKILRINGKVIKSATKPNASVGATALAREVAEAAGFAVDSVINGVVTLKIT